MCRDTESVSDPKWRTYYIGVRARGWGGAKAKWYLLNEKTEFIPSSEIKCPKSAIFTNNYWMG